MRVLLLLWLLGMPRLLGAAPPATCFVGAGFWDLTSSVAVLYVCTAVNTWTTTTAGNGVPVGALIFLDSGSCPTGWTEATALDGKTIIGTIAAHSDVGTTGGTDSVTPAGTNSAPTFTGNNVVSSAVTAGTPAGTNGTGTVTATGTIAWPVGVPTAATEAAHKHDLPWQIPSTTTIRQIAVATFGTGSTQAATAVSAAGTANTTSAAVASSGAGSAHTHVLSWPAGVPTFSGTSATTSAEVFTGSALATHTHTTTATGTNSAPVLTGTAFDNRSAFIKVIACRKS